MPICPVSSRYDVDRLSRFSTHRYPKLRKLQDLKSSLCDDHAHPPLYITLDPSTESPRSLTSLLAPHVFDVVLIRPPQEYTWPEIIAMPIRLISSDPGFVFLWVGSSDTDGLERGREALLKWGFRRCEEIVWINKNTKKGDKKRGRAGWTAGGEEDAMPHNLLVNQKEHCLVGIRGTVRRKTDNWFVHCNVGEFRILASNRSSWSYSPATRLTISIQIPTLSYGKETQTTRRSQIIHLSCTRSSKTFV